MLRRETGSGLLLTALGVGAVALSLGHRIGTGTNMGPGFFPLILGGGLLIVGLCVLGQALLVDAGGALKRLELRPGLVLLAMTAFALTIRPLGFFLASALVVVISGVAHPENRAAALAGLTAVLVVGCWLIFIQFLGAPMHPWGRL